MEIGISLSLTSPKGVGGSTTFAFTFQGQPFTFAGVAFTYGAAA